ncbi:TPM domain-containing protein [Schleiferilactobacillus shenzhenensis]|uniref:TPM domain-containing protein n=1 Tax=Schleiferilactobacillus shenzhenensis TaxID=1231337 RepID=UPI00058E28B7|nr:TPM domain-containing protein [Schleiferilactobacillus shenzhenensis]
MIPAAVNNLRQRQGRWGSVLAAFAVLWGLLLVGSRPVQAASLPVVLPANGVADTAGLVDPAVRQYVAKTNTVLGQREKKLQVLVVTVPRDKSLVATEKFVRAHYLPDGTYRAALLYAPNSGQPAAKIITSHALTPTLTKAMTDRILSDAAKNLRSPRAAAVNTGFRQTVRALTAVLNALYHYPQPAGSLTTQQIQDYVYGRRSTTFSPRGILLFGLVLVILFFLPGRRRDAGGRLRPWWQGSGLVDEHPEDDDDEDEQDGADKK